MSATLTLIELLAEFEDELVITATLKELDSDWLDLVYTLQVGVPLTERNLRIMYGLGVKCIMVQALDSAAKHQTLKKKSVRSSEYRIIDLLPDLALDDH